MPPLARDLIDSARIRHWSFADTKLGDGAALMFLNGRQRTHLAALSPAIEGIIGETVEHAIVKDAASGKLVILINNIPVYSSTTVTGFAVYLNSNNVPFIDPSNPTTLDPFGIDGSTPGFPLPGEMVRLINVGLVYGRDMIIPCDVIQEKERFSYLPGRNPAAFVSGNRLVPLMPLHGDNTNTSDRWMSVTAIQISYVAMQELTSLDDIVKLPTLLTEALVADLAVMLAGHTEACPPADRQFFVADAARCGAAVSAAANDLLDSVQASHVLYKR